MGAPRRRRRRRAAHGRRGDLGRALRPLRRQATGADVPAPRALRDRCASDLRLLAQGTSPGRTLTGIFTSRLPDYQANLLGFRFLARDEREAYVRQNVRPLAREFGAAQLWRLLLRALYELQYLDFSEIPDRRAYFLASTWFARDFFACGALDEARCDDLAAAARALCTAHAARRDQAAARPGSARAP